MEKFSAFAATLAIFLGSAAAALANGAVSEFPAGGVVFKHEKEISIAREDLEIGWRLIRVHYVFVSSASKPIEHTIGFPLAKVPLEAGPDSLSNRNQHDDGENIRNYMVFKVSVNGKPLTPKRHEYAWLDGVDITGKLRGMGIPPLLANGEDFGNLAGLPMAMVDKLLRAKLAKREGNWLTPLWKYQSVYEWTQSFAPGKTEVEISYRPLFGATNAYGRYNPGTEGGALYCPDDVIRQKFAALRAKRVYPEPFTVGYILKTARNWKGPIGDFRLAIKEEDSSFSSFCVPAGLARAGANEWRAKDFIPNRDLKIVFYLLPDL
jgi:hypothetical protein